VFIASFGAIFSKMSSTGVTFFFVDCFRKVLFIVVLSAVGDNGAVQTGMSAALAMVSFTSIVALLPYNDFSANLSELSIHGMQMFTMVLPFLAYLKVFSFESAIGAMGSLSFATIGFSLLRTLGNMILGPILKAWAVVQKCLGVLPGGLGDMLAEQGVGATANKTNQPAPTTRFEPTSRTKLTLALASLARRRPLWRPSRKPPQTRSPKSPWCSPIS
jgi:hypothetical protein